MYARCLGDKQTPHITTTKGVKGSYSVTYFLPSVGSPFGEHIFRVVICF